MKDNNTTVYTPKAARVGCVTSTAPNLPPPAVPARLLAHKGPRNAVKLLLLTVPRNSRRLGRVYDPEDVLLEITLTAGAVMEALTKAVPVGVRYTVGPRGHEIKKD